MTGTVFNIQRFSINDGPGIRTTVFLKGCPLHCKWCHNPESISGIQEIFFHSERCIRCGACVDVCANNAAQWNGDSIVIERDYCDICGKCVEVCYSDARNLVGREVSAETVLEEILKDVVFYDQSGGGVTFSGGEPLLQHEFLVSILHDCKKHNIHTAVDTSGFVSPDILRRISKYTDLFLYDIKVIDKKKHETFTGVPNELIHENLKRLVGWGKEIIVRIPVIPDVNDDIYAIREIGSFVSSVGNIKQIHILPYHSTGKLKYERLGLKYTMNEVFSQVNEKIMKYQEELRNFVRDVEVEGS